MKNVRIALISGVVALAFAFGGCGGDSVSGKYSKLVDEMCKCTTSECASKVKKKRSALQEKSGKPSKSDMKKIEKLDKKWRDCRRKAQGKKEETKKERNRKIEEKK